MLIASFLLFNMRRCGDKFLFFDSSKAIRELGYEISPMEKALGESVDWFLRGREERLAMETSSGGATSLGQKHLV